MADTVLSGATATVDYAAAKADVRRAVEDFLQEVFADVPATEVAEAARYAALGGGHRWRALVAVAAGKIFRDDALQLVLPAACGVELAHAASLVLDDLPSMDDACVRRGKPCTHRAFPAWATIPSYQDLATGRVIHFFFAWALAATLLVWLVSSLLNGHIRRDLLPRGSDVRGLPGEIAEHLRFRFHHRRGYNIPQKFSYAFVLFILLPLMILTGLTMSPAMDTAFPFLLDIFGGRQTARTIHFAGMALIVLFFVVHILMVLAAGPLNELRSIVTGWYRTDPPAKPMPEPGE